LVMLDLDLVRVTASAAVVAMPESVMVWGLGSGDD
jgi:hypothetical protein